MTAYIYKHIRLDNNEIFYIGVGGLNGFDNYKRMELCKRYKNIWIYSLLNMSML